MDYRGPGEGPETLNYRLGPRSKLVSKLLPEVVFKNFKPKKFRSSVKKVQATLLKAGWKFIGEGRHRRVYLSPDGTRVAKVTCDPGGIQANLYEWLVSKEGKRKFFYYNARRIPIPQVFEFLQKPYGVTVLVVEKVTRLEMDGYSEEPLYKGKRYWRKWVHQVDCDNDGYQIGHTDKGRVVCFDWCMF